MPDPLPSLPPPPSPQAFILGVDGHLVEVTIKDQCIPGVLFNCTADDSLNQAYGCNPGDTVRRCTGPEPYQHNAGTGF